MPNSALSSSASSSVAQWANGSAYAPSSITVAFPAAPAVGHLLVVAFWNNGQSNGSANTYAPPAGWTRVDENVSRKYASYQVYSHVVAGGESNAYVFRPLAAQREHVWIAADTSAAGVDGGGNAFVNDSTAFGTPSLAPPHAGDLALAFNMPIVGSATWSNPPAWAAGTGPTSVFKGESLTQSLSTTSKISESATLSTRASGFASLVFLTSPVSSTASPAAKSTPTPTPAPSGSSSSTSASVAQWSNGSAYAPSSITVKFPSAPAAGHLLIVELWNNGQSSGAANTYAPPAGWNLVDQNTSHAYTTYQVFSHVVASGESNAYAFRPLAAQREHVWIAADSTAAGVDGGANAFVNNSSAYATPTMTPAHAGDLALAFGLPIVSSASWSNPSGWSPGTGPTSVWEGESLTHALSTTSSVSESATLSTKASGFASLVLLTASTTATPAPVASATTAPTAAPIVAPTAAPTTAPTSAPAVGVSYHGCPLYTANDWFTTNLVTGGSSYVSNSIDPNSANIINNVAANVGPINFAANSPTNSETANLVTSSNQVASPQVQGLVWGWANDPYNDAPSPPHIPIGPGNFYQEGTAGSAPGWGCRGGDCHVVVLNTSTCVDYETYKGGTYGNSLDYSWNPSNGTYWAQAGGVENLNHPYNPEFISTAAGIPMMGTTDWGEDETTYNNAACASSNSCVIPHSIAFLLPHAGIATGGWVTPAVAQQQKCTSYCTNMMPMGARLRLHASYPCPSAASYPQANMVCNQLKQYGMVLNDYTGLNDGGGLRFGTSSNGANPWNSADLSQLLKYVHITDFDVMKLGTIHT